MSHKKILVAYDKSRNAKRALAEAVEILTDSPEAVATVLYVCDKPTVDDDVTFDIAARLAGMVNLEREGVDDIKKEFVDNEVENLTNEIDGDLDLNTDIDGEITDILEVSKVTGVKGEAETTYRTGNVNLTRANLGIAEIEETDIDSVTEE